MVLSTLCSIELACLFRSSEAEVTLTFRHWVCPFELRIFNNYSERLIRFPEDMFPAIYYSWRTLTQPFFRDGSGPMFRNDWR